MRMPLISLPQCRQYLVVTSRIAASAAPGFAAFDFAIISFSLKITRCYIRNFQANQERPTHRKDGYNERPKLYQLPNAETS